MRLLIMLWFLGLWECRGGSGLSWDSPDDPRGVAYDRGRHFGRTLLRLDKGKEYEEEEDTNES